MNEYPVRAGSMLYTLVDPNRGYEVEYNRWYERDHFMLDALSVRGFRESAGSQHEN